MKRYLLLLIAVVCMVSCQYKELCFNHPHTGTVRVIFDWSRSDGASPESMDMFFYPADGTGVLRRTLAGCDGGEIELPVGEYVCVCTNGDSEDVYTEKEDDRTQFALTTAGHAFSPLYTGYALHSSSTMNPPDPEGQQFMNIPDAAYSAKAGKLAVLDGQDNEVTFVPERRTTDITVIIRNVSGIEFTTGIRAYLSGLDRGYLPFEEKVLASFGIEMLTFEITDASTIKAELKAFGHTSADSLDRPHILSIVSPLDGQFVYRKSWDVSSIVNDPKQDPSHIIIELDGLEIPEPEVGAGLFDPSVTDWGDDTSIIVGM